MIPAPQHPQYSRKTSTQHSLPFADLHSPSNFKLPEYLVLSREKRKQLAETATVTAKSFHDIINTTAAANRRKILFPNSCIDEYGNTILHLALANQDLDFACILLLKGANPNLKNYAGFTPIHIAQLMKVPVKHMNILQKHSSTPFPLENYSPLVYGDDSIADAAYHEENKQSVFKFDFPRVFIPEDPPNLAYLDCFPSMKDLNTADGYGCTPLMKAAYKNHFSLVENILAQPQINITKEDQRGYNALIWACLSGGVESFRLLQPHFDLKSVCSAGLSPLMAAIFGGNSQIVSTLLEEGVELNATWKSLNLLQVAIIAAQMDIAVMLKITNYFSDIRFEPESVFFKALMFTEHGSKAPRNLLASPNKMPNGLSPSHNALMFFEKTSPNFYQAMKDDKTWEPFLTSFGTRLMMNALTKIQKKPSDEILDKIVPECEFKADLKAFFKPQGTQLDLQLMMFARDIISLVNAVDQSDKAQYVLLSGKAVQTGTEILRAVESYFNAPASVPGSSKQNAQPSSNASLFHPSKMFIKIRDLCKSLKNEEIKSLLLATRLAVGAWPPPDAVSNMIKSAIKMSHAFKKLVAFANASGFFPLGLIDLKQFLPESSELLLPVTASISDSPISPSTPLSYSEYQRQQEAKVLNQIVVSSVIPKEEKQPNVISKKINAADENFFSSLDNLVRLFVQTVLTLKQLHLENQKQSYPSASAAIYARIDAIFEEVREYYIFKHLEDSFSVDGTIPFKKRMSKFREQLFGAAESVILKSKLASGVWPPPEAASEMIKLTFPCVVGVKDCVEYVKTACDMIRNTEDEDREKMEAFMVQWEKSAKVRNVFDEWEKLQMVALKDKELDAQIKVPGGDLTPEVEKLLADGPDGLIIEEKDGKTLVKGGRLLKLVEKLADHNYADPEYRTAFLLTYPSFTNALELLDLLMKRYDISPPYGLDQRLFETYVNRKVVPVRLRVFNVLKQWMGKFTEDFTNSRQLTEKCLHFVETKMSADFGDITSQMLVTLKRSLEGNSGMIQTLDPSKIPPKPIIPKGIAIEDLPQFLTFNERAFIDIDPLELARQITLVDSATFKDIRAKECLDQSWEKADKLKKSPNICRMIKNTNDLTMWVASSIVKCEDLKVRVSLIRYFVNVAQGCRELNNFNAITAFVAGLTQGPVFRMTKTWTMFREKLPKVADLYDDLSEVVSAKGQYSRYRSTLKQTNPPLVPFLGVFLTDLTFVELGNLDFIPELNFINFDKRRKVASIVNDISQYQLENYVLTPIQPLKNFIMQLGDEGWLDEKGMYSKSLETEPREESDEEDD